MDKSAFTYADPADPLLKRLAIGALEVATGRNRLRRLYFQHQSNGWEGASFFDVAIKALSLDLRYNAERLAALPKHGPLVVVSNHPFGVLDGIVMCALMRKARPDFLVLTNAVLLRAPEMRAHMLPIDFTETMEAQRANVASRARALSHLQNGGCIVIFPAGAISTSPDRLGRRPAVDRPWTPYLARLVQRARAPVTPVFFHGQNSRLFQIVSHISMTARLALFFHELRGKIGARCDVTIGETIPFDQLAHLTDRQALVEALRAATYSLNDSKHLAQDLLRPPANA
jgi:putative hemolysin